jgi:hypothetical protein
LQGVQIVRAAQALIDLPAAEPACIDFRGFDTLKSLSANWTSAANSEVFFSAIGLRRIANETFDDADLLTLLFSATALAPRFPPTPGNPFRSDVINKDLSTGRLLSLVPQMTPFQLGTLHTAIRTQGTSATVAARAELPKILARLEELKRVTGRTAYLTEAVGPAARASTRAQAAALRTLGDADLAAGVANDAPRTAPSYDLALVSLALAEADVASSSATPDLSLTVSSGNLTLLEVAFGGAATAPVAADGGQATATSGPVPFERFGPAPEPIQATAEGRGNSTVSMGLAYVPAEIPTSPSFAGLYVSLVYRNVNDTDGTPIGPALQVAPLAATLVVTVQVCLSDVISLPNSRHALYLPLNLWPCRFVVLFDCGKTAHRPSSSGS